MLPLAPLLLPVFLAPEIPPIGIIDTYGRRRVSEGEICQALGVAEGEPAPADREAALRRLRALPRVRDARIHGVCCDDGEAILYVGIEEEGAPSLAFRPAPTGGVRLPPDAVDAGAAFEEAARNAVLRGDVEEDDSAGHALLHDPDARVIQEKFVGLAARDPGRLRDVLRNSADAGQRALAAQLLGYSADKASVVPDLVDGMRYPDEEVRNNAMRALGVIGVYAARSPEKAIRVPGEPFVDLLNSIVWTDRNKAAFALVEFSRSRDPVLLALLRDRALPSLVEMARWKSWEHASAAFFILGRAGGLSEEAIELAWEQGDRDAVIDAARKLAR